MMPEAEAIQELSYQGESEGHEALRERPATEHGEPFAGLGEHHEAFAGSRADLPGPLQPGDHFGGERVGLMAG
jgi:hypothetical protein